MLIFERYLFFGTRQSLHNLCGVRIAIPNLNQSRFINGRDVLKVSLRPLSQHFSYQIF